MDKVGTSEQAEWLCREVLNYVLYYCERYAVANAITDSGVIPVYLKGFV